MISENWLLHPDKQPEHIARRSKTLCLKANLFALKYCGSGSRTAQQLRLCELLFLRWMAKVWMSLVVMQRVPQLEEPSGAELLSAAPRSELYRGSKIHAIVQYREEQAACRGRDELVSSVSGQQSLLRCRSPVPRGCSVPGYAGLLHRARLSGWGAQGKLDPAPVFSPVDDASLPVSWKSLSPKAAVCVE